MFLWGDVHLNADSSCLPKRPLTLAELRRAAGKDVPHCTDCFLGS